MKTAIILTVASLAAVLGAKPADEVKTEAAAGRYGRPSRGYGGGYGYQQPIGYWQPLIQDRFVCDLDASVLLVVDSNRHHHRPSGYYGNPSVPANRAVRVKCAEVANHDIDSCNLCCQQTARRDTSLPNDKLFGFLALTKTDDDETFKRSKRGADDDDDDEDEDDDERRRRGGKYHRVDSTYVSEADWSPPKYHSNVKCVCCAPRTNPAAQNPSTYSNPPAASNPTGYGSNTFTAVPAAPVNTAASQPLVDSWQSETSGNSWNTGSAAAPAAPSANWNTGSAAAPAAPSANWNTGSSTAAADSWGAASDAAAPAPPPAAAITTAPNTY
ncbi:Protein CBR-PERM-4 [Caenorhabditis briggsae]|uniref:Protein CBR-PERM-4 n=1 Tax=Caenorhabditis briggsae TaxID=6238 RepID=A8XIY1_CAEBR|nr:Protein CBR-PERM-4 [Caenorhabditis briggsae]CAP32606.2 Protein CBR-PERM-4 [Caenorhabditis briggsae]